MRLTPVVAIVSFLVLLLTWLSLRAINPQAELFDQALAEIDHFATVENALYRDVFTARAGTLRNYDPLVHEVVALRNSLDRLRRTAVIDAETAAAVDQLAPRSTGRKGWSSSSRVTTPCCTTRFPSSAGSARVQFRRSCGRQSAPLRRQCCI